MNKKKIEVFKSGKHTSGSGLTQTFTSKELDEIVKSYDKKLHSAPVVIGHSGDNDSAPSFGWVKKLERKNNKLFAHLETTKELDELIEGGYYKKVSISLYSPDTKINPYGNKWGVRHLAVLGASPPAVKGLEAFGYSEDLEGDILSFSMDVEKMKNEKMDNNVDMGMGKKSYQEDNMDMDMGVYDSKLDMVSKEDGFMYTADGKYPIFIKSDEKDEYSRLKKGYNFAGSKCYYKKEKQMYMYNEYMEKTYRPTSKGFPIFYKLDSDDPHYKSMDRNMEFNKMYKGKKYEDMKYFYRLNDKYMEMEPDGRGEVGKDDGIDHKVRKGHVGKDPDQDGDNRSPDFYEAPLSSELTSVSRQENLVEVMNKDEQIHKLMCELKEAKHRILDIEKDNQLLRQTAKAALRDRRKGEISQFVNDLYSSGKMVDSVAAPEILSQYCEKLTGIDDGDTISFSEKDNYSNLFDGFKQILSRLPVVVSYKEMDEDTDKKEMDMGMMDMNPHEKALKMMEKDKKLTYTEAIKKAMFPHENDMGK